MTQRCLQLLSNNTAQWNMVEVTGRFLKTLDFFSPEDKSWEQNRGETLEHKEDSTLNTLKMLCSHRCHSSRSPFMEVYMPVHSLWPEVRPLLHQRDLMQRVMDKLQQQLQEKTESAPTSTTIQPVCYQLEKKGENFELSLDTGGFSPEELSVRQVGRKVIVGGKTEKKQEDGNGSFSYKYQQFRQEVTLPQEMNPEALSCYMDPDGKLHIQAAKAPCVEEAERELEIRRSSEEDTQQSVCSHTQGSSTETDQAENMD
ncbi:heat shock protein 30-like [Genypterus blacodes]|uniref:heat shock protein 30-like n=1 Tax=Genypterus blacodes TaxID=154954 RepID=UPI003F75D655